MTETAGGSAPKTLAIVVPTYKEEIRVITQTVRDIRETLDATDWDYQILVVNDGSGPGYNYDSLRAEPRTTVLEHAHNKGYGGALKTGIQHTRAFWIGITDADGTYPVKDFPRLLAKTDAADMVVGARRLADVQPMRRLPKYVLNRYASFLANEAIADLNTGLRVFKRDLALEFWPLFPDGFSMSSTLTMASLGNGKVVADVPIDYYKREGKSSIHPIKDTIRFFKMVGRLGLYFNPLRIFGPIAGIMLAAGFLKGVRDYVVVSAIGNLSTSLMLGALQLYFMGLLADLITKRK